MSDAYDMFALRKDKIVTSGMSLQAEKGYGYRNGKIVESQKSDKKIS